MTGNSAGGERFQSLLELVNETELNSMVIDIKDDHGYLTYRPEDDSPFYDISKNYIANPQELMETLEENEVYPIARIVVFKDSVLAEKKARAIF